MDLAFAAAGFDILFQVEIDPHCRDVLYEHRELWPNAGQYSDIRSVGRYNLPRVDVLFGGFPCQPHSVAGKRLGADDSRNLWPEFGRVIGDLRPRAVLLENVPGILTTMGAGIIADLASLGYVGRAGTIRASDAGAPHKRERWFCVAYATSERLAHRKQIRFREVGTKGEAEIQPQPKRRGSVAYTVRARLSLRQGVQEDTLAQQPTSEREGNGHRVGRTESRLGGSSNGLSRWMDESYDRWPAKSGEPQHEWEPPRTAPTDKSRRSRVRALGNAVVPQVIYPLATAIREVLQSQDEVGS